MFIARSFSSSPCNYTNTLSLQTRLKRGFTPTLDSINRFLRFLSQKQKFNSIFHFVCQMKSNQIEGNSETHSIFTWALLKLHKFEEAHHFMSNQKENSSFSPKSRVLDSLVQGFCIKRKDTEKALLVLKDCLMNHGILPSSFTFCSLIYSFSSQGNMSRAVEVLELMTGENAGYPFTNFVCSSVISGFCKIGKPELAKGFFENAVSLGALRPNVISYTALVSALCMLGRIHDVYDLFTRMENEGLKFDVAFYGSWICEYFKEGMLLEAFSKHREMLDKGIEPDTISYTIIIDGFSKEGNVEKAVGILNKMIKDGIRPNLITYTAIILGFCKKGKLEEAFTVFKKVEELGIVVDEFIYATLIDGVCRRGDLDCAFDLLEEMEKKGIKPSIITYNTVINGLCKVGRTSKADEVSKGILGDVITYSTLLHGCIEEENVKGILETKQRLEEGGIKMDVVMCNVLIKALFMVGALEDAHSLYQAMPEMDLVANSVTYTTMIDGYCKVDRIDEALEIFDEFRATAISSAASYNCIINGLCKKGMVNVATEVFIELNEKGLGLDAGICKMLINSTFAKGVDGVLNLVYRIENLRSEIHDIICNHVIRFLCKKGFCEVASEVCMLMTKRGSVVTSKSYYSILSGLTNDGKKWLIRPLLNIFIKKVGLVEPMVIKIVVQYLCLSDVSNALWFIKRIKENSSTVSVPVSVLKKLIKEGRVLDAYKLVTVAKDNFLHVDVVDYSTMVAGLCREGYVGKALDLCAFVRKKGITLNIITYNSVINGLCHQGCFVEAFRLFDSFERTGMVPSELTYAILINNLCKERLFVDAKKLFERMVLKGLKPITRVYNSFIAGYCSFGQMAEALRFLQDLEVKGLNPDEFTVSALINGFCQTGDMEGALGIFTEFKRKDVPPDFLGFLYLIKGLCTKGRMEEARSILREMLQSKSTVEIINRVDMEVESESVLNFLVLLCEQGSILEAVTVLNEIGSMFFPPQRGGTDCGLGTLNKLHECESLNVVVSRHTLNNEKTDLKLAEDHSKLGKRSQFHDFDFCYSKIASYCSKRELHKANRLIKEMLSFFNGDS